MQAYLGRHPYSSALIVLGISLVVGSWIAHRGQEQFVERLDAEINIQRELMGSLATITDRNGADEIIGTIVTDCPRRNEFDALLITLSTLTKQDLLLVQSMFETCGSFYPKQKALVVMRLQREFDEYSRLLALKETLVVRGSDTQGDQMLWGELVSLEKTRSDLLNDQSRIQQEIIRELVQGRRPSDASVQSLISEAQAIAELLSVYDKRIDEIRTGLVIT